MYLFISRMTYKYVIIMPLFSSEGPPARMLICHPVCCIRDLPIIASMQGSLSITLVYMSKSGGSWISRETILTPEILYFSQHLHWLRLLGFHHDDSFDILCTLPSSLESLGHTSPAWIQTWSETESSEVSHLGVQQSIPCDRYPITPGWPISILSHMSTHNMLAMAEAS